MNSIMERWIGSCRRELLDRTLIWNQRHLMTVLPLSPSYLTRKFNDLVEETGLPPVRLHDLRHGAATLMQRRGVASNATFRV